jgi:hypothetical protein
MDFRLWSWVTASSDAFFTQFVSCRENTDHFFGCLKTRLRDNYARAGKSLARHGISFSPANAGIYLWLDLSGYLHYFEGKDERELHSKTFSSEVKLCRWLISRGLFILPGEVRVFRQSPSTTKQALTSASHKLSESTNPGQYRFTITINEIESEASIERLASCLAELRRGCLEG